MTTYKVFVRPFLISAMVRGQSGKKKRKLNEEVSDDVTHDLHQFSESEATTFRTNILKWFSEKKRDLPWRRFAVKGTLEQKAYAVLVSEIMLQQTQVATVIDYYTKWMERWPTFEDLAKATPEEVNEMWSGLGYYSRGRRLLEAAQEVCKHAVEFPCPAEELQNCLPGVGRYTASAVASIVFGERVAAVDGNVVRVLSRQRVIGSDSSSPVVMKQIWDIGNNLVDPNQPGNFNEAMMELGAVICTPKTPKCSECPVRDVCLAYKTRNVLGNNTFKLQQEPDIPDIEMVPGCKLCLPADEVYDASLGVMNYPRKVKKAPPRKQESVVWILQRVDSSKEVEYFMVKRPNTGLLANLWEFPCYIIPSDRDEKKDKDVAEEFLETHHGVKPSDIENVKFMGKVVHLFSHIHQSYVVFCGKLKNGKLPETSDNYEGQEWMNSSRFDNSAASTAMRKVFDLVGSHTKESSKQVSQKRIAAKKKTILKKNSSITDFFSQKNSP